MNYQKRRSTKLWRFCLPNGQLNDVEPTPGYGCFGGAVGKRQHLPPQTAITDQLCLLTY